MKNVYEIRRDKLRDLIDKRFGGSQTRFADEMGWSNPSLVSRYLKEKPIGYKGARKIEKVTGQNHLWMDVEHNNVTELTNSSGVAQSSLNNSSGDIVRSAPLLTLDQAIEWTGGRLDDAELRYESIPPLEASSSTYVLQVSGIANEPDLMNGHMVVVDPRIDWTNEKRKERCFVVAKRPEWPLPRIQLFVADGVARGYLMNSNPALPKEAVLVDESTQFLGIIRTVYRHM